MVWKIKKLVNPTDNRNYAYYSNNELMGYARDKTSAKVQVRKLQQVFGGSKTIKYEDQAHKLKTHKWYIGR